MAHVGAEVFEEIELAGLGPVEVFEHEDGGALKPEPLDEPTHSEEERCPILGRLVQAEPQEQREVPADLRSLALGEQLRHEDHQFRA